MVKSKEKHEIQIKEVNQRHLEQKEIQEIEIIHKSDEVYKLEDELKGLMVLLNDQKDEICSKEAIISDLLREGFKKN